MFKLDVSKLPTKPVVDIKTEPLLTGLAPLIPPPTFKLDVSKLPTKPFTLDISRLPTKPPKTGYGKFVEGLSKISSTAKAPIMETVEYLSGQKPEFEPLARAGKSLLGQEKVTAADVFGNIPSETEITKKLLSWIPDANRRRMVDNMILNLPKETASTLISIVRMAPEISLDFFTDPTTYILGGAGKVIGGIKKVSAATGLTSKIQDVAKTIAQTPAGQTALKYLVYRGDQPTRYKILADRWLDNVARGKERGIEVGKEMTKGYTQAEQQRIGRMFRGETPTEPRRLVGEVGETWMQEFTPQEIRMARAAETARGEMTRLGEEAVKVGLLDEAKYLKNIQNYQPRLYRQYEQSGKSAWEFFGSKPVRIKGQRFMLREEIPAEIRVAKGEILEPGYPVAKGISQITQDIETTKFLTRVSKNTSWVKDIETPGFVKMPVSPGLRDLSGKYVLKPIANDINEVFRATGAATKLYDKYLSAWKFAKTALQPATHLRNIFSNTIFMDLSGIDHIRQITLLPRAAKDLIGKGKYFQELKSFTGQKLLGKEFYGAEIKTFMNNWEQGGEGIFNKIVNVVGKSVGAAGKVYRSEDQIFKMAKYVSEREAGRSIGASIRAAEEYFFNYQKVSKAVSWARRSPFGSPFITFTTKALPVIAKTTIENPLKTGKYVIFFKALENVTKDRLGLTDEELAKIKGSRKGISVVLPAKDKEGQYQVLDLAYILPWGDISETGGMFGLPPVFTVSNPLTKTIAELIANKDFYTEKPIYLRTDSWDEKAQKIAKHLYIKGAPLPSWVPAGYSWNKVISALREEPDFLGRERALGKVLLDVMMGIKISPVSMQEVARQEYFEREEDNKILETEIKKIMRQPQEKVSSLEKRKAMKLFNEKRKKMIEDKRSINESIRILLGGGQ